MPSNIKNFFKPIPNAKNPHKEKPASIENNKENQAPPTVETLNSDKKSISSQHEEKELVDLTQPISPKPSNIQTSDPTTPNKNTRRSSRPTTPVTPNPNDTSISPKPRKNNKKLTVEEKAAREEARRIEREKKQAEKEAKKLEDKKRKEEEKKIKDAEKEKKKAEEKAIKDKERADKKAKEAAEREAKKAKEAAEKEAERKRKDAERKVLAEQKKIEAEAKKEKDKKEREAKKEEEKRKKEEERLLEKKQQEEKERLKAEKLKAKRWGGFLKVEKKSKKELSDVQRGPFRLEFQKRKFYVNPSEVYSDFVRKAFGKTENSFFVENDSMDIDENSNYLSELSERSDQLKIVGTGLKLKILENNRESEIICLEDDQKSPTHPLNFFHYKTCKRFYYGTSSTFRTAAGNNSRKIARNPFRKQQSIFVRNGIELDYDYDSEYEWENEPSDAESCDSADEEEDLDDQHDNLENDDFCVPHGYLSDDEEGHEQAQAEENLNYKKQKIKSLIPYVLVKNHGDNGNESPRQSEHLLVKNLAKIGVAMVKTKVIDQTPKVSICAKSEHFRDVSDLRSLLENVQIGKIPRRLTRETDQTKVSASFPCMDDLCKLLHMNPLALSKITEEFKMHLEMKRGKKEIPGYTLPTIAQIKKRIQKISQCRVKDGNELEVGKMKYWQVKQCVLDRFYKKFRYILFARLTTYGVIFVFIVTFLW